jgi:hypothetical protein
MEAAHPDIDSAAMLGCWRPAKSWFVEILRDTCDEAGWQRHELRLGNDGAVSDTNFGRSSAFNYEI